jgi:hypothetical protein
MPQRHALTGHLIQPAAARGWLRLQNGALIAQAGQAGFELRPATGKPLRYPQNLTHRCLAMMVLLTTRWPRIEHGGCAEKASARPAM